MDLHITCRLLATSAVPRDEVQNTWAIQSGAPDSELIAGFFGTFYESLATNWLATTILRTTESLIVDFAEILPGGNLSPIIASEVLGLPEKDTPLGNLPQEVALCATLVGDESGGQPARRRRGRVYIGPFDTIALGGVPDGTPARPQPTLTDDVNTLVSDLRDGLDAGVGANVLSVWSRAAGVLTAVSGGWCDDEFDTQRRRQRPAVNRYTWGSVI